jgi:hypothetical protein
VTGGGPWIRRLRAGFLYLAFLVVVTLVLLEAACRLGVIASERRRTERRLAAVSASTRLLVLGDSFSLDQEDLVMGILRDSLEARGVGVLNLARSGTSPLHHLGELRRYGPRYHPDVVLLAFYVGNDFTDTRDDPRGRGPAWERRVKGILANLHVYQVYAEVKTKVVVGGRQAAIRERIEREIGMEVLNPFLYEQAEREPAYVMENLQPSEAIWRTTRTALEEIARETERMGAKLVLCALPHTAQVNRDLHEFLTRIGYRLDEGLLVTQRPQELVGEFCRERGILYHDLLPRFREAGERHLYLDTDIHLNAEGNRFAAEMLGAYLDGLGVW